MLINFNEYINCCFSIFSTIRLLAIRVINSNYQYNIAPRPVVQSSISLHVSIPVYLRCSSTTSNHLFLGLPCGLFPSGFHFITDLTVLLSLLLITYPSHRSLCHLIKIVTGVTSTAQTYRIIPYCIYFSNYLLLNHREGYKYSSLYFVFKHPHPSFCLFGRRLLCTTLC